MKKALITNAIILLAAVVTVAAQSRTNRIYRPCPASVNVASVSVDRDGSISITPCSGKTLTSPGIPLTSYLSSDLTYISNTTMANSPLSVTIPAAGNYKIDLFATSNEDTGGLKFDFAGTATIANFIGVWYWYNLSAPNNPVVSQIFAAGTDFSAGLGPQGCVYRFTGTAEFSTAGTFTLRGSQTLSVGIATTVYRGSVLVLTKL